MKKSISFGLTLLIVLFLLAQNLSATQKGIRVSSKSGENLYLYKDYHALVVGIGDYDYWPDLRGTVKDAREVAEYLKLAGMKVSLVLNSNSRELKRALNRLIYEIGREKDRAILFFFSGHGETETIATGEKLGYIVPKDCPTITQDYMGFIEKAISMNQIETYALRIRSKHVLMVFDSCFSGSVFASLKGVPTDISEKSNRQVRQFITAGNENEQVPDESFFKTCFTQGIDGEADYNKDGYVTGSELGMYLDTSVVNYSRGAQHPQYGKIRHPALDKGDFVFLKSGTDGLAFYKRKAEHLKQENEILRQQLEREKLKRLKKESERKDFESKRQKSKIAGSPQTPVYQIDSPDILIWSDYSKPLKLERKRIDISSPLKVRVNIPETFIKKFRKISLVIYSEELDDNQANSYLNINDNKWYTYNFGGSFSYSEDVVKIPTKLLKSGENILKFSAGGGLGGRYELIELRFNLPKNNLSSN